MTDAWMCADCRSFLGSDSRCDRGADHDVVNVATGQGRTRIAATVRKPSVEGGKWRKYWWCAAAVFFIFITMQTLVFLHDLAWWGPGPYDGVPLVIAYVVVALVVAGFATVALRRLVFRRDLFTGRAPDDPELGSDHPPVHGAVSTVSGTVIASKHLRAPLSDATCVAYTVAPLGDAPERQVLVRHGETLGFDIEISEDRSIRVPPGRIRIAGLGTVHGKSRVRRYLAGLLGGDARKLAPAHSAVERVVKHGDRVELFARIEERPKVAGYRDAGWSEKVVDVAVLRVA